jgi:hypothetical protein
MRLVCSLREVGSTRMGAKTPEEKKKHAEYMRDYDKRNPEKKKRIRTAYREKHKANQLRIRYNLTAEDYNSMLEKQNGVCALCGLPERIKISKGPGIRSLAVDHDHNTGKVRALLCHKCNVTLGTYEKNRDLFVKFDEYIKEHGELNDGG